MRELLTRIAAPALLAAGLASLVACGGSNDTGMPELAAPERGATPVAPAEPAATEGEDEPVSSRAAIERHDFSAQARDPFTPPRPERRAQVADPTVAIECDLAEDPLGETEVEDLTLIGLITGTAVPRAMFAHSGANGRAVIVTEGARVGPNCSQFISDIRDNEVVVTQRSAGGEEMRTETSVMLNTERVEAEFLPLR